MPLLSEYFPILVFIAIGGFIALAMVGGSLLAAQQKPYAEKLSPYECGFELLALVSSIRRSSESFESQEADLTAGVLSATVLLK